MNDPQVKTLHYAVVHGKHVDYKKAKTITFEANDFTLNMDPKEATFEMRTHYATTEEARAVADLFLRRWEVLIGLEYDPGDLKFVFRQADIIDRAPAKTDSTVSIVHNVADQCIAADADVQENREKFPSPPNNFDLSPNVETMYTRYKSFWEGRETLLSMAHMCLTVLENSAGGRANAAKNYSISKPILDKLGNLCAEKGDQVDARKAPKNRSFVSLSDQEKKWIKRVIKAIIRRAGEVAHNPTASFSQLTMDDFPTI